ncbi:UPF0223 family protein [Ligilactobacillus cholophilus]|uniref:UPF0223 family protein n=1 Tax=Ligilactobacillus cholophilus TaxID=3050131 RepID=UPI0025B0A440|nr:UPF0223 family protein [Ligilactobacillus cholophilus]
MQENYSYPLMDEWSKDEIIKMVEFYAMVEKANTIGVNRECFLKMVEEFKKIEPSIAAQKQIDHRYKEVSGFSIYKTIKSAQESNQKKFKMR